MLMFRPAHAPPLMPPLRGCDLHGWGHWGEGPGLHPAPFPLRSLGSAGLQRAGVPSLSRIWGGCRFPAQLRGRLILGCRGRMSPWAADKEAPPPNSLSSEKAAVWFPISLTPAPTSQLALYTFRWTMWSIRGRE